MFRPNRLAGRGHIDAADDYRHALELNPESDIIKHNIDLIEDILAPKS